MCHGDKLLWVSRHFDISKTLKQIISPSNLLQIAPNLFLRERHNVPDFPTSPEYFILEGNRSDIN